MVGQGLWTRVLHWRGIPLLVLALGLGLSLAYWQHEREIERQHLADAFDASLRSASWRIEQRVAAHEHLLQGLQGFVRAAGQTLGPGGLPGLTRYVDALPLGADFAGLQGLVLAVQVGGPRGEQARVLQVEPAVPRNSVLLGHDLLADATQRQTLERARDSGRMALSPRLDLGQLGLSAEPGFLMVLPVYAGEPASVQQRREQLRAWVLAPVQMHDLMASLYGEMRNGLALALHAGQHLDDAHLLYRAGAVRTPLIQAEEYLVLGGQTWTLSLQAGPTFAQLSGAAGAGTVLAAGAGFSLLLALLAWLLGTARERAQHLAERMTQALRLSEQRWAFALEGAGDGVWDWQTQTGQLSASERWRTIMGLPAEASEAHISQVLACIHAEDLPRVHAELQRCLDGSAPNLISEHRIADGSGGWRWVLARGTVIERDRQGRPLRMIGTLSDITARRDSEERVRFMALHDPLTELANRAHFDERMHFALANARRYNESLGLILLDLDRFKPVNDQFGHAVGDQLLQTVARRIRSSVRETDTVGRIGGDEFVVLLTGPVTRETAQVVADKIFNQVALPMELAGLHIEITCSLGLALYPEDGQDELALAKAADESMYRNKRAGRRLMDNSRSQTQDETGFTDP